MPSWRGIGVGLRHQEDEVRPGPVGDERLRALDHVLVAVADRLGADPRDVGARARLGDPEAADLLALDPRHQVALLLLLGAEQVDRGEDHVGLDGEAHVGSAGARVAHALRADQRVVVVAALARRTPPGSRGRGSRARRRGASPRWARSSPPTRCGGARAPSCTQASIDSRRSSCSSVNRRCLRFAAWSGLMTVAVATASLLRRSAGGLGARRSCRVLAARSIEYYFILCATLARVAEQLVLYEVDDGVATVTLNDPEKRNRALRARCSAQLVEAMQARPRRRRVRGRGAAPGRARPSAPAPTSAASAPTRRDPQALRHRPLPRVLPADAAARQAVAVRRQRPRASPAGWGWRSPATW